MTEDDGAHQAFDEVTQHVCTRCLGAILRAGNGYECADCGHTGSTLQAVCGCGWRLPSDTGRAPARFQCIANPARSAENPALFVIAVTAVDAPSRAAVPARSVSPAHAVAA